MGQGNSLSLQRGSQVQSAPRFTQVKPSLQGSPSSVCPLQLLSLQSQTSRIGVVHPSHVIGNRRIQRR